MDEQIYGVLSYSVVQRSAQIAIRMAVGAQRTHIIRLVFAQGAVPLLGGRAAGIILSVISTPWLDHLLFEIKPGSPETYVLVTVIIFVLSAISMVMPAIARCGSIQ
jgi:ABC-type lipoprotein release transport system permease subunit